MNTTPTKCYDMETWDLQLSVPDIHIILESTRESYAAPVIGSLSISAPSSNLRPTSDIYPNINISLTRYILPNRDNSATLSSNKCPNFFARHIKRQKSTSTRSYPHATQCFESRAETLVECDLRHAPDEIRPQEAENRTWLKYNFSVPVPGNLPPTAETRLGDIMYAIEATVPSSAIVAKPMTALRRVKMVRRAVAEPVHYFRRYPGENVITELRLSPKGEALDVEKSQAAYSAQWMARSTITQGARKTEVKYVVAKEIAWRVEETVKYLSVSRRGPRADTAQINCKSQVVRQLCDGRQKGRWIASGGIDEGIDWFEVPFDITIPRETKTTGGISSSSYMCQHQPSNCSCNSGQTPAITVDHQLVLEVITGEDTFDRKTGNLVDRRHRVKSFEAVFPL
ncbi:hypothetical protein BDV25DRAFT_152808, partial [Aspergillus avenaceus]